MEFLKGILSEETYNKLVEELKDKTDVKLGNLASGEYEAKGRSKELQSQLEALNAQLTERNAQLDELSKKAKGNEELTAEINALKEANEKQKQEYEAQISTRERDYAIDDYLRTAGARNLKAVRANLELDKFTFKDNKIEGLEDAVTSLKTSEPYLFAEADTGRGRAGLNPNEGIKPSGDQFAEIRKLK